VLGPYDIANAQLLADSSVYVGRLIQLRDTGEWTFLAFNNQLPDGTFGGTITDPLPVSLVDGSLVIGSGEGVAAGTDPARSRRMRSGTRRGAHADEVAAQQQGAVGLVEGDPLGELGQVGLAGPALLLDDRVHAWPEGHW
jgi:hypothetical protein